MQNSMAYKNQSANSKAELPDIQAMQQAQMGANGGAAQGPPAGILLNGQNAGLGSSKAQHRLGAYGAPASNTHHMNHGGPSQQAEYAGDVAPLLQMEEGRSRAAGVGPARDGAATTEKITFQEPSGGSNLTGAYHQSNAAHSAKRPPIGQHAKGSALIA